ncbi:hypothetical protein PybrP1_001113 [[Pythium] brassicae (nom. inval.)]|nr:hypothetical protein PybrP1_001113 [[Pythium] brassicae (nom. inval.)]
MRATTTTKRKQAPSRASNATVRVKRQRRETSKARHPEAPEPSAAVRPGRGELVLCEVGERGVLSFLPLVPDRLVAERVCTRWRRVSLLETPTLELDFGNAATRSVSKLSVQRLLQRTNRQLRRLALPDMKVNDAIVQSVVDCLELRELRAHRYDTVGRRRVLSTKHVHQIVAACRCLEELVGAHCGRELKSGQQVSSQALGHSLELLDCHGINLAGWGRGLPRMRLRNVRLHGCSFLTNAAAYSLIERCGSALETLVLTGWDCGEQNTLTTGRDPLGACVKGQLTLVRCYSLDAPLPRSEGVRSPASRGGVLVDPQETRPLVLQRSLSVPELTALEVLMLDRTTVSDSELSAIASAVCHLKYLSLQDCRYLSDAGILAIADGCSELEVIDLKGTNVTDESVLGLERACARLRIVRLDSCRSISRAVRVKYNERARAVALSGKATEFERSFLSRKKSAFVSDEQGNAGSASDSDFSECSSPDARSEDGDEEAEQEASANSSDSE